MTDSPDVDVCHATCGSNNWATARGFAQNVAALLGIPPPTLDLAARAHSSVCGSYYGPDHVDPARRDAMDLSWSGDPLTVHWLNPPYSKFCLVCDGGVWTPSNKKKGITGCASKGHASRGIGDWMAKACLQNAATTLVLVPASTSTKWWRDCVLGKASRVLFLSERMKFLEVDEAGVLAERNGAPFSSALIEYAPGQYNRVTQMGSVTRDGLRGVVPPQIYSTQRRVECEGVLGALQDRADRDIRVGQAISNAMRESEELDLSNHLFYIENDQLAKLLVGTK